MPLSITTQQKMYDALRRIAHDYQSPAQLQRTANKDYGLEYGEVLEMAYENIQTLAADAIRGLRRPKEPKAGA